MVLSCNKFNPLIVRTQEKAAPESSLQPIRKNIRLGEILPLEKEGFVQHPGKGIGGAVTQVQGRLMTGTAPAAPGFKGNFRQGRIESHRFHAGGVKKLPQKDPALSALTGFHNNGNLEKRQGADKLPSRRDRACR